MATSNTLTGIIPTLYEALNVVSREMVGFIPAVRRDSNAERAAVNQTVRVPLGESGDLENITPGAAPAASGGTTVGYADIVIENSKAAPVLWSGEERLAVGTNGTYNQILADQFTDAMRKLVNAVESDISTKVKLGASRAYGDPAGSPFNVAGKFTEMAKTAQILDDNGAPQVDRQLVLGSSAIANLRGLQSVLFKTNEAGSADMLRDGMTDRLQGFALRYSGGIKQHTTTAINDKWEVDGAGALGLTKIVTKDGTTATGGPIKAGDIVSFASGTDKYIVTGVTAGGVVTSTLSLNAPGLVAALAGSEKIVKSAAYYPNAAFSRNAVVLAARAPAVPEGGDSADDAITITDPLTGMTFEVRVYRQYRQVKYEVCLAWGSAVIKPEHVALLIGQGPQ